MNDELYDLLETAIYKEIASETTYQRLVAKTYDPAAAQLMRELAAQEEKHKTWLKDLREKGAKNWHKGTMVDLKLSDYMTGAETLENAGLQDTLIYAIKREQSSIDFYSRMTGLLRSISAKRLCRNLVNEEIRHKIKLELLYDDLFLSEN